MRTRFHYVDVAPPSSPARSADSAAPVTAPRGGAVSSLHALCREGVKGHKPILALVVEIETVFFHCGKASMRSEIWNPQAWTPEALPSHAQMVTETLEALTEYYGAQYEKQLY